MLSKCANPDCSEVFLRIGQGKVFRLSPSPTILASSAKPGELHERFWLCDLCSQVMTVVWGGSCAKVVPLQRKSDKVLNFALPAHKGPQRAKYLAPWMRAASAGRED